MKEKQKGYISFPKEFLDYDITLQEALLLADICGLAVNNKIKSGACIASNSYLSLICPPRIVPESMLVFRTLKGEMLTWQEKSSPQSR